MSTPVPEARRAEQLYDPTHDLSVILAEALRKGYHDPGARASLARLCAGLGLDEISFVLHVETAVRIRLAEVSRRAAARENVEYLASLNDEELREALLVWKHERPDSARRLLGLLTGRDKPRYLAEGDKHG